MTVYSISSWIFLGKNENIDVVFHTDPIVYKLSTISSVKNLTKSAYIEDFIREKKKTYICLVYNWYTGIVTNWIKHLFDYNDYVPTYTTTRKMGKKD